VIEHLQQRAVEPRRLLQIGIFHAGRHCRRSKTTPAGSSRDGDGRIGDHALEVALRERGAGREHNGRHGEPRAAASAPAGFGRGNRQQNPQETIHAILDMTPVSSIVTGLGASEYAAGSQVWNGISGTIHPQSRETRRRK